MLEGGVEEAFTPECELGNEYSQKELVMKFTVKLIVPVLFGLVAGTVNAKQPPMPESSSSAAYRFEGFSTQTIPGTAGLKRLYEVCQEDFNNPNARMCNSEELLDSVDFSMLPSIDNKGWLHPKLVGGTSAYTKFLIDYSGMVNTPEYINCNLWSGGQYGLTAYYKAEIDLLGISNGSNCLGESPVTCCTPK